MKKLKVEKPGKSKKELLSLLEKKLSENKSFIKEYNANVQKISNGYSINVEKKMLFLKFFLKASITVEDETYIIEYETNAPDYKVKEFEPQVIEFLEAL